MLRDRARELLPIIEAFANGKSIEYKNAGSWKLATGPDWSNDIQYRIKLEPKLVPFTFEDNLLFRDKWFKYKDGAFRRSLKLVAYEGDCVTIHNQSFSYQKFLDNYIFEDGSPCGKYINE